MNWNNLFSPRRLDDGDRIYPVNIERSEYEKDFDRVVFSSAFRRLQDKTQVIPLPESDFVHSRLTHSLEVSCVGRSLGKIVGKMIIEKHGLEHVTSSDFGSIVAAACLAHDIGNPPFGHSGESAISNYFINGKGKAFEQHIDKEKWKDLTGFEGNANGFRLLAKNSTGATGGLSLTYTTLAAFSKYTCKAFKENRSGRASQQKYGYFIAEQEAFKKIYTELQIPQADNIEGAWLRHPLAFLVEAADDICYRIIDFEDGVRIGLVAFETAEKLLIAILDNPEKPFNKARYDLIHDEREKMGYLRSLVINKLIQDCAALFVNHEAEILTGAYDKHLTDELDYKELLKQIEILSVNKIYNSKAVLQIEIAGFNVIAELLDYFITAVNDLHEYGSDLKKKKLLSAKLIKLLPAQFVGINNIPDADLYLRLLNVCEFIAGMTDGYAMTIYKRLKGIELPHE